MDYDCHCYMPLTTKSTAAAAAPTQTCKLQNNDAIAKANNMYINEIVVQRFEFIITICFDVHLTANKLFNF